jgi:hypothetical protein
MALEITVTEKDEKKDKKRSDKQDGDPPPIGLIMLTLLVVSGLFIGNQRTPSTRSEPSDSQIRIFIP